MPNSLTTIRLSSSQCIRTNNWINIFFTSRQYSYNIKHYSLLCHREQGYTTSVVELCRSI